MTPDRSTEALVAWETLKAKRLTESPSWPFIARIVAAGDALAARLSQAEDAIRANHAWAASVAGAPCTCEWCAASSAGEQP